MCIVYIFTYTVYVWGSIGMWYIHMCVSIFVWIHENKTVYINLQTYTQKHWLCIYVSDMCMSMYECVCVYVCMLCVHELCKSMYMFLGMCLSVFIHRKHMCLSASCRRQMWSTVFSACRSLCLYMAYMFSRSLQPTWPSGDRPPQNHALRSSRGLCGWCQLGCPLFLEVFSPVGVSGHLEVGMLSMPQKGPRWWQETDPKVPQMDHLPDTSRASTVA